MVLSIIFALGLMAQEGAKSPFTIADYYRVQNPGEVAVCPVNSEKILFSLTSTQLEKGTQTTQLFLLNSKDSEPRQITFNGSYNGHPFWSKDGSKIYFLSTREDGTQLWVMDSSGGEPHQLTHFSTGIDNPVLHPDGHTLIFSSTVFPECMEDSDCNKDMSEKLENGPVQAHMADQLLYRHWTEYRDFQYSHLFKMDLENEKITAITKGKIDYPAYGGSFDLSPDGSKLVVTVKDVPNPEISTNCDIYLIDLQEDNPEPVCLTKQSTGYDGDPLFSPDGQKIAYRTQKRDMYESDLFELMIYDLGTGKTKKATVPYDNWIQDVQWGPEGKSIFVTTHEKGYFPVYKVDAQTGAMKRITGEISVQFMKTSEKGFYSVQSSVGRPREIYFQSYSTPNKQMQLTHFNRELEQEVDIRPAESVMVDNGKGHPIQMFIVKPHDFDPSKSYPLILNVHGGPQYQWADTFRGDWQVYPGAGYIVAFPNPHGSSGFGQEYTEAISGDYNGKVMDDIETVTNYLAKLPWVDENRMGAMGWSWGGYAMMWLEGHNKHFKAIASMMGIYDLASMYQGTEELWFVNWDNKGAPWENGDYYKKASPSSYVTNFKTPCLVITGEKDYRVPYTQSLQFFTALQRMKVPSRLIVFPNDGHWPNAVKSMPVYYNAHLEWFHTYLGGGEAPWNTEDMIRNQVFKTP